MTQHFQIEGSHTSIHAKRVCRNLLLISEELLENSENEAGRDSIICLIQHFVCCSLKAMELSFSIL